MPRKTTLWIIATAVILICAAALTSHLFMNETESGRRFASYKTENQMIAKAMDALAEQKPHSQIVAAVSHEGAVIFLTADFYPNISDAPMFRAFVAETSGEGYRLTDAGYCEPAGSSGFSAAIYKSENRTVVFGDLGQQIWNPATDEVTKVEFTHLRARYEGGEQTVKVTNRQPYLLIIDGAVEITDIEYYQFEKLLTTYATAFRNDGQIQ